MLMFIYTRMDGVPNQPGMDTLYRYVGRFISTVLCSVHYIHTPVAFRGKALWYLPPYRYLLVRSIRLGEFISPEPTNKTPDCRLTCSQFTYIFIHS